MKQYKKKIVREFVKRRGLLKRELKIKILKSILQNLTLPNISRIHAQKNIQNLKKIKRNSQINKVCMLTGKKRGISTAFFLSRHMVKKLGNWNELSGVKIKS
jgi:ribosomal protein S14